MHFICAQEKYNYLHSDFRLTIGRYTFAKNTVWLIRDHWGLLSYSIKFNKNMSQNDIFVNLLKTIRGQSFEQIFL